MTTSIDIRSLPQAFQDALAQASAGGEVILVEGNTPRARVVPIIAVNAPRVPGLHPGAMQPSADFDALLPDEFWTGQS